METIDVDINELKDNPKNPRKITNYGFCDYCNKPLKLKRLGKLKFCNRKCFNCIM